MNYDKLGNLLDNELEKIAGMPSLNDNAVALLYKLVDIKKDLCEVKEKEMGGYSNRKMMGWYDDGITPNSDMYNGGNSYAYYNRPPHIYNDGYSRGGAIEHLQMAMNNATSDREREAIREALAKLNM